jgi:hypothetical protein
MTPQEALQILENVRQLTTGLTGADNDKARNAVLVLNEYILTTEQKRTADSKVKKADT